MFMQINITWGLDQSQERRRMHNQLSFLKI